MHLALSLLSAVGFGALYGLTVGHHGGPGAAAGIVVAVLYLVAFLLPRRMFTYSNSDLAPVVLLQLGRRWVVAVALTLLAAVVVGAVTPLGSPLQLMEELYLYSMVAVLIFHGLAGLYADHVVYLQVTKQYNSNQLLAITMLLVVMLTGLILYFLAFDFGANREGYVYVRDLGLVTLAIVGFGWHAFRIGHH